VQGAFRARLIQAYGERCMAVGPLDRELAFSDLEPGRRCEATRGLQAHHGKDGMIDMLLCQAHHKEIDSFAR
jgi:predicted restriction endonuclease